MDHPRVSLITGATGQDGALLASALRARGDAVTGTTRGRASALALDGVGSGSIPLLSVASGGTLADILRALRPTEVYHLAGQSSVGESFRTPVETFEGIAGGTLALLESIRQVDPGIRLFVAGSGEAFGDTLGVPATEGTPFSPRSPYATAKAAAANLVANYREAYGLHASTGFLFNHESPRRPERFVTRKVTAAAVRIARGSGERLRLGNLDVQRDWGWADEYVEAMQAMLRQDAPGDYVIATGETCALADFVAAAFAAAGLDWRDHVEFDPALARPTDIAVVRADPSRAMQRLGWRARTRGLDVARRMVEAELASL
jgi:GDPmannose 4,6-dehydratase